METLEMDNEAAAVPFLRQRRINRLRQTTNREVLLSIAICILTIISLVLVVALFIPLLDKTGPCVTRECVKSAALIINNMNVSADPCTDFYDFACGSWKIRNIENYDVDNWFNRHQKHYLQQAAKLLTQENVSSYSEAVEKARVVYRDCLDVDALDHLGVRPLMHLLERAGLPSVPSTKTLQNFDLSRTIARVQKTLGIPLLINVLRASNDTFSLTVPAPNMPIDPPIRPILEAMLALRDHDAKHHGINLTQDTNAKFVKSISPISNTKQAFKKERFRDIRAIKDISQLLDKNSIESEKSKMKLRPSNATKMLYNGNVPNDPARTLYYDVFMETLLEGRKNVNWSVDTGFIQLNNFSGHQYLVNKLKRLSPLKILAYIWNEVVKHFGLLHTTKEIRQSTYLSISRSYTCFGLVLNLMPRVIDHLNSRKDPLRDASEKVTAIAREIKKSQMELVKAAKWIGKDGQQNILRRLDDVTIGRVGYTDWITEGDGLDAFYNDVVVHSGQLLRTMADIQVWQTETKLLVSPKIGRLRTDFVTVAADYDGPLNTITLRPVILQFPFYGLGLDALNYGAIGGIVGHEVSHALDKVFLESGNWSIEQDGVAKIKDFLNCTVSRVEENSRILNAESSLGTFLEDVADVSGARTAFHTYTKIRSGTEPLLPGLEEFNHEQLFFLAYANAWCSDNQGPMRSLYHNSEKIRIFSATQNSPAFAKFWNCSANTPMNPEKKCILW